MLLLAIFLAERDRSALVSFAETAAALALVSLLLAGWPLHADYLELHRTLWTGFFETLFDEIVALMLFLPGNCLDMFFRDTAAGHDLFAPIPPVLALAVKPALALLAVALLVTSSRQRRTGRIARRLMGLALLAALPGPPGWSHHYPLPLLLMPALLAWLPGKGIKRSNPLPARSACHPGPG